MPLIRTIQINASAKIGIWDIAEPESFFTEKVRVEREVHHPHKRLQHLAARYLLQVLEPAFPVQDIRIMASRKPFLPGDSFHFSLAHSGNYAVAIVSEKYRTGIDVEKIGPQVERLASKFLNAAEREFLDESRRIPHLTVCWGAKEAVYKWHGLGNVDFKEDIHLHPFLLMPRGQISCNFTKQEENATLVLHYLVENDHCVAWVVDDEVDGPARLQMKDMVPG